MGGGEWKVAYADFTTAMMAFFLLMWLLNAATEEQKEGIASYFQPGADSMSSSYSPVSDGKNSVIIMDKLDMRVFDLDEMERSQYAIIQALKQFIDKDLTPSPSSGVETENQGVLLKITSNLMFKPDSIEFSADGIKVLNEVVAIMEKYKVYLIVRGHSDASESGAPYESKWDLSAARSNAAVSYLIDHGANPKLIRSVAYADTRPLMVSSLPGAREANSRVEFSFHRPEVMSTIVSY